MHLRSFLSASLLAATASAQQSWPIHSENPELTLLQDFDGYRTSAYRDLGMPAPTPAPHALVDQWQTLGPFGGDIEDVQVSPVNANLVLAGLAPASGSGGGLYRSTNLGTSWSPVASLAGLMVHDLAFAPDGTAYAGTVDGVWTSVDGGLTFSALPLGIGVDDQVLDVDVDPNDAQRLWVGVADALGAQPVNVLVSTNGGATWTNRTPPLAQARSCASIAIDPTNSQRVFAGFRGFGGGGEVWVSTDGGASWTNRSAGLPGTPVNDLEHDGTRVYVAGGQLFGGQNFGLYTSANDGANWTALHTGAWPSRVTNDIAIDPNAPGTILVATALRGIFRTTNAGASWAFSVGGTSTLSANSVAFAPASSATIFVGATPGGGVWKSTNAATAFGPSSVGIVGLDVHSVTAGGDEIAVAFQGLNDGGVYVSTNEGRTWTLASLPAARFNHVQHGLDTLYALAGGPVAEGLYERTGTSWSAQGPTQGPGFDTDLKSLCYSFGKALDSVHLVGADTGPAGTEPAIWRIGFPTWTWAKVYEGPQPQRTFRDCWGDISVWACFTDESGSNAGGVIHSDDGQTVWQALDAGLPVAFQGVAMDVHWAAGELLVTNGSNVGAAAYRSDGVSAWVPVNWPAPGRSAAGSATDANAIYLAVAGPARVLESLEGGATFTSSNTGLPPDAIPHDLQLAGPNWDALNLATSQGTFSNGLLVLPTAYCFGDGTGTACPCAPPSPPGTGCLNSFGTGAQLAGSGWAIHSADSLVLSASGLPPSTSMLFFQGTIQSGFGAGTVSGDGLRCAGGTIVRIGAKQAIAGAASYPGPSDVPISVRGFVPSSGGSRTYQVWYRNVASFCTSAAFNYTNGVSVVWVP